MCNEHKTTAESKQTKVKSVDSQEKGKGVSNQVLEIHLSSGAADPSELLFHLGPTRPASHLVPVLGSKRVRIEPRLNYVLVHLRLDILKIVRLGLINPIVTILCLRILDLLERQEIPVSQWSNLGGLVVNQYLVGPVCVHNQGVKMSKDVFLASDDLLDQVVLALVLKADMDLLGAKWQLPEPNMIL